MTKTLTRRIIGILIIITMLIASVSMLDLNAKSRKPGQVKNLTATAISYNAVKLKWKKARRARMYRIYISTGGKYKYKKKTRCTSCTIKKLKGNKNYRFKVRALRGKKKGKKSKAAYAKTYCKVAFVYKHEKNGSVKNKKKVSSVRQGNSASAPKIKTKLADSTYSYKFTNWNKSFNDIQNNKTITAKYDVDAINEIKNPKELEPTDEEVENEVFLLINTYRKSKGLNELKKHAELSKIAKQRAQEDADGYFDYYHHSTISGSPSYAMEKAGLYPTGKTGENANYCRKDAKEAFSLWKQSIEHNANMLEKDYIYIGIAVKGNIFYAMFSEGFSEKPTSIEYDYYVCKHCNNRQRIIRTFNSDYWKCLKCKNNNKKDPLP